MANNFKIVQAQPFALSGAGVVAGATTIVLKSFAQINGTLLTMTDFGSVGYGTLEPGNGTLEEQIIFTGVVQNSNGTATLTGVSTVAMVDPYTTSSGLAQTHAGSTTFVLTNTARFYNQFVAKDDDGTISEVLTFTVPNSPRVDDSTTFPTDQAQFATKAYADSLAIAGAPNATTTVKGIVQLPTQAQVDAGTAAGSTGASLTPTPALLRSKLLSDYVADTGAADAYVITPAPAISAYTAGQIFSFKALHTNTTVSTLNVNALGVKAIKRIDGATALQAGDIVVGQIIVVEYDGTNFQMVNPAVNTQVPAFSVSNITMSLTTTNGTSLSWGRPFDYQEFIASGTWTKPTGLSGNENVRIQMWGGGGAGGGASNASQAGGGGGGGAFVEAMLKASDLASTITITVPAAAAGVSANTGSNGGNVTFGTILTANGGAGGVLGGPGAGGAGGAAPTVFGFGYAGTAGTVGAGGAGTGPGPGGPGGAGGTGGGGTGGAGFTGAIFGGVSGAGNATPNSAGQAASGNTGGGGGGAGSNGNNFAGGAGAQGRVRVWTFY